MRWVGTLHSSCIKVGRGRNKEAFQPKANRPLADRGMGQGGLHMLACENEDLKCVSFILTNDFLGSSCDYELAVNLHLVEFLCG